MGWEYAVAAIVAALAAGAQQYYSNQAQKAANSVTELAYKEQAKSRDKINDEIANLTAEYENSNREKNFQQDAEQISNAIKEEVSESQALRDESQKTEGNVSNDYASARESSQAKTMNEMNAFADLLGRLRSQNTVRQKEGINAVRAGQRIGVEATNARGNFGVRSMEAEAKAHKNDGKIAAAQIVGTLASLYSMGAGMGASAGTQAASSAGTAASSGAGAGTALAADSAAMPAAPSVGANAGALASTGAMTTAGSGFGIGSKLVNAWNGLSPLTKSMALNAAGTFGGQMIGSKLGR